MTVASVSIRSLLQRISLGEIRIPAFQREFVWDPNRVQFLMDSIYKGYPIGTLLLWRTKEKLEFDRKLGAYTIPEPKEQYPIDYVLDGQQRLTSIFGVFQTELAPEPDVQSKWMDIYFDLQSKESVQDSQFIALATNPDPARYIPLKVLFDVAEYGKLLRGLDEPTAQIIFKLHSVFTEAQIPVETVETDVDAKIAIIFERVNRGGVPLDTYQLLAAWTWSGDFDLRTKFDELAAELDDFSYGDIANEPDLLLKCCAAVIKDEATSKSIVGLNGADVRDRFDEFTAGLKGAIEFLQRECNVASMKVLPYPSMLVPLSRCFATKKPAGFHPNAAQRGALKKWFWQSCFSRRYSSSVDTAIAQDIDGMIELLNGNTAAIVRSVTPVAPQFFQKNAFSLGAVNSKTFVLLLAQAKPKSFISGANVDLDAVLQSCNRTEFHHVFPKNFLQNVVSVKERDRQYALANFAFLSQKDNRSIKDKAPDKYLADMPDGERDDILSASFIPQGGLEMAYDDFIDARSKLLADEANKLI